MSTQLRFCAVSVVAVAIAAMNMVYAWGTLQQFLEFGQDAMFSQVAISAISAQSGIVVILAWVLANPLVRRGALLAMIAPMLVGNLLYSIHLHLFADAGIIRLAANAMFAVVCSLGVYWVWRRAAPTPVKEDIQLR